MLARSQRFTGEMPTWAASRRYTGREMRFLLFAFALALPCCTDFATPAELESRQILAITSEPASLSPGSSATLAILVADQDGPVLDPDVTWSVQEQPGLPALGSIVDDGSTVTYTAPDTVPELPTLLTVEARVADGENTLVAIKGMLIGGPLLANPEIVAITVDGNQAADAITLVPGQEVSIGVALAAEASADATYAWYARPGKIDEYRSTPTTLLAPNQADEGWLYVVVRDLGGIAFHSIPIRVQ